MVASNTYKTRHNLHSTRCKISFERGRQAEFIPIPINNIKLTKAESGLLTTQPYCMRKAIVALKSFGNLNY